MDYARKMIYQPIKKLLLAAIACLGICSCSYEFPDIPAEPETNLQSADLSKTVFIGSSAFSGVTDGVLTPKTSLKSIPQILINEFTEGNETLDFSATSNNEIGFNVYENLNLNERVGPYQLKYPASADSTFFMEASEGEPFTYKLLNQSLLNFSFPKAQILDYTESNRSTNSFINSYFTNTASSLIDQIIADAPSFFMLNIGYEDLLGYAINGAEGTNGQTNLPNHSYEDILAPIVFEQKLQSIVDKLLSTNPGVKGALFNIPDFLKYPFFTKTNYDITPFICIPSTTGTTCVPTEAAFQAKFASRDFNNQLASFYNSNPGIPFEDRRIGLDFRQDAAFNWGILVEDNNLPDIIINGNTLPKVRHMLREELVFYPNQSFLDTSKGFLPSNALGENQYLKVNDIELIRSQISTYNNIIESIVSQSNGNLVLIDINAYYERLFKGFDSFLDLAAEGELVEGVPFLPIVGKFGIFSADGLNLNPRGNALIVNQIIETLNLQFNGNLNKVNPNEFAGTSFVIDN